MHKNRFRSLGQEGPLDEGMATPSSILAWRIPWMEEPGGLQSMGVAKSRTRVSRQTAVQEANLSFSNKFVLLSALVLHRVCSDFSPEF